jgi:hypothetical protein
MYALLSVSEVRKKNGTTLMVMVVILVFLGRENVRKNGDTVEAFIRLLDKDNENMKH